MPGKAGSWIRANQHSLSDAENFSEGYQFLKLGKVVGEPTAGWVIATSNIPLIDGSIIRVPFVKVTDHQGKNMELASRPVDIFFFVRITEKMIKVPSGSFPHPVFTNNTLPDKCIF